MGECEWVPCRVCGDAMTKRPGPGRWPHKCELCGGAGQRQDGRTPYDAEALLDEASSLLDDFGCHPQADAVRALRAECARLRAALTQQALDRVLRATYDVLRREFEDQGRRLAAALAAAPGAEGRDDAR